MAIKTEQRGSINTGFQSTLASSSWRQEQVTISGNSLKTVIFNNTTPNMFYIQNPNDAVIHVGISHMPTTKNYEFKVQGNGTTTFGRPTPTTELYLLNMSNAEITVSLFSVYDNFDMSILQNINLDMSGSTVINDGIIKGFGSGVMLPTGTNTIGKVLVDGGMLSEDDSDNIAGTNNSLEVLINESSVAGATNLHTLVEVLKELRGTDLTTLMELKAGLTELKQSIASLSLAVGSGESSISDFMTVNETAITDTVVLDFTDGTQEVTPNFVNFITNDGDNDLSIVFGFSNGTSRTFVLKAGESITDLSMNLSNLTFGDGVTECSYRAMLSLKG